ncbi:MAG: RagB/SusD family nutrient uptake outer membrane protein, partial [Cyclobacteriaceae bacterium]
RFNGVSTSTYPEDVSATITDEDFIDVVREERRLEFAFEFKRWYDLKRWGILNEAFEGSGALEPHTVDDSRDYLFPLPQIEVDVTGFKQNDGY